MARGFVSGLREDSLAGKFKENVWERREAYKGAFQAAMRGAAEEWREHLSSVPTTRSTAPPEVREAYARLNLRVDSSLEAVDRARRDLVKLYHPDKFSDPLQQQRAERITSRINSAHDTIERYLIKRGDL